MFLILKTIDWKEEDYIKNSIILFGWIEDNNRASNEEIVAKVQTEEQDAKVMKMNIFRQLFYGGVY